MAFEGFDFLSAEEDMSKKVEELASILENVAKIFLNGIGSLEKLLDRLQGRLTKVETQMETLLKLGVTSGSGKVIDSEAVTSSSPKLSQETMLRAEIASPPPKTPTSPMGATSGMGIQAQIQSELRSFLARRRAAIEQPEDTEE